MTDAAYEAALQRYLRGEITSEQLAAADPHDAALRRMAQNAYERYRRETAVLDVGDTGNVRVKPGVAAMTPGGVYRMVLDRVREWWKSGGS